MGTDTYTGPDVCDDEGAFTCDASGGGGMICCGGVLRTFDDGPCGVFPDAGDACATNPTGVGCPCDVDAGTLVCVDGTVGICLGGTWQRSQHACGIC